MTLAQQLLAGQGAYYVLCGLWPVLHMRSFLGVTGPKSDHWLVKTAGLLIATIGASLASAALRGAPGPETIVLAAGSAFALAAVDVVYSVKRVISYVYLLDAVAETALLWLWAYRAAAG